MKWLRLFFRTLASLALACIFAFASCAVRCLALNRGKKLEYFSRCMHFFAPILLRIMGVRFRLLDHTSRGQILSGGTLLVANHLSYKDIFILAAIRPMLFISSVELSRTFFLGQMARFGGTVFVERRSRAFLHDEIQRIASLLRQNFVLTLFPEAGTSDGHKLLPFKSALFQAAIQARAVIQPVCIRYTHLDDRPVTPATLNRVVWHRTLFPLHILKLFTHSGVRAEVHIFEAMEAVENSRKNLVHRSFELIRDCYQQNPDNQP